MAAMADSPARVIQYYLVAAGAGALPRVPPATPAPAWLVTRDTEPVNPDAVITVYDTTPVGDGRDMRTRTTLEHPGVQVRVRALTADAGKAKARQIAVLLDAVRRTDVVIGPVTYRLAAFTRTGGITPLGQQEQSDRQLFVLNGTFTVRQLP